MPRRRSLAAISRLPGWFRTCRDRRPVLGLVRDDERPSLAPDLASSRSRRSGRPVEVAGMRRAIRETPIWRRALCNAASFALDGQGQPGARASQARDPPRRSCGAARQADASLARRRVMTSQAPRTASCLQRPTIRLRRSPRPARRVNVVARISTAGPRLAIRSARATARATSKLIDKAGGFNEGPTQSR